MTGRPTGLLGRVRNGLRAGSETGPAASGPALSRRPPAPLSKRVDLILHLGMGKTGTSSVQFMLRDNRERLRERGVLVPTTPGGGRHQLFGLFLKPDDEMVASTEWPRQQQPDPASFRAEFRNRLLREIEKSGLDRVLLTDEILFGSSPGTQRRLAGFTDRIARSSRVVVYLRRQDDHLVSRYQQVIKTGGLVRLRDWMPADADYLYDYAARLRRLRRLLAPTELVVRRYERDSFVSGSIYQDFLDAAGIDVDADELVKGADRNLSLDAESVEFLRLYNLYRVEHEGATPGLIDNRDLGSKLAAAASGPVPSLPADRLDEFMARWEESNARVARRYLGDPSGVLFRAPRKTSGVTTEQRLDPARLGHFFELAEIPADVHRAVRRIAEREAGIA